jgi:transketolase
MAVVAKTVKGWGCPSIQGGGWHGKPPAGEALTKAIGELDELRLELTNALGSNEAFTIQPPEQGAPEVAEPGEMPSMNQYMRSLDMEAVIHSGRFATRKAYGVALRALGETNPGVVVLDADVSNSTFARPSPRATPSGSWSARSPSRT